MGDRLWLEFELLLLECWSWRHDAITGSIICISVGDTDDVDACRRDATLPDFLRCASAGRLGMGGVWPSVHAGDDGCTVAQWVMPAPACPSGEPISRYDTDTEREREDEKRDADMLVRAPPVVVRERFDESLKLEKRTDAVDGDGDCRKDEGGRHLRVAVSTRTRMRVSQSGEPNAPTRYPVSAAVFRLKLSLRCVVG